MSKSHSCSKVKIVLEELRVFIYLFIFRTSHVKCRDGIEAIIFHNSGDNDKGLRVFEVLTTNESRTLEIFFLTREYTEIIIRCRGCKLILRLKVFFASNRC